MFEILKTENWGGAGQGRVKNLHILAPACFSTLISNKLHPHNFFTSRYVHTYTQTCVPLMLPFHPCHRLPCSFMCSGFCLCCSLRLKCLTSASLLMTLEDTAGLHLLWEAVPNTPGNVSIFGHILFCISAVLCTNFWDKTRCNYGFV